MGCVARWYLDVGCTPYCLYGRAPYSFYALNTSLHYGLVDLVDSVDSVDLVDAAP